jgi:hypothetical protein
MGKGNKASTNTVDSSDSKSTVDCPIDATNKRKVQDWNK